MSRWSALDEEEEDASNTVGLDFFLTTGLGMDLGKETPASCFLRVPPQEQVHILWKMSCPRQFHTFAFVCESVYFFDLGLNLKAAVSRYFSNQSKHFWWRSPSHCSKTKFNPNVPQLTSFLQIIIPYICTCHFEKKLKYFTESVSRYCPCTLGACVHAHLEKFLDFSFQLA